MNAGDSSLSMREDSDNWSASTVTDCGKTWTVTFIQKWYESVFVQRLIGLR